MGYQLPEKNARLHFVGTEYDGLEVVCRLDVPMGLVLEFMDMARLGGGDGMAENGDVEKALEGVKGFEGLLEKFNRMVLVEWNLEREGKPVLLDIMQLPTGPLMLVLQYWMAAIQAVPAPLAVPSVGGNR